MQIVSFKKFLTAGLILVTCIGFLSLPVVSGTTIMETKKWVQNSDTEFQKGNGTSVRVVGGGKDAYLTLENNSNDSPLSEKQVFFPPDDIEVAKNEFDVVEIGKFTPISDPLGNENTSSQNGEKVTKRLGNRQDPDRISFFLWTADDCKKVKVSFKGDDGNSGIVLTTVIHRDGFVAEGMLRADDGDRGVPLAGIGDSSWVKVILENINYQEGNYDGIIFSGGKRTFSNIEFYQNIDSITKFTFETGNVKGCLVPLKMNGESWGENAIDMREGLYISSALDSYQEIEDKDGIINITYDELYIEGTNLEGIKLQIAHSNDNSSWSDFVGPTGSSNSYYHFSDSSQKINLKEHENYRYLKYKIYLKSSSAIEDPKVSEVGFKYTVVKTKHSGEEREHVTYKQVS